MLKPPVLDVLATAYLGGADPRSATASPLWADLAGLPPILMQVGTAELLLDESKRFADKARAAGVDITHEPWQDAIHVWHLFADLVPEGREAIAGIAEFLDKKLG